MSDLVGNPENRFCSQRGSYHIWQQQYNPVQMKYIHEQNCNNLIISIARPSVYKTLCPKHMSASRHKTLNHDNCEKDETDKAIGQNQYAFEMSRGARWQSGRASDPGARGHGFETYLHGVVSLSKPLYSTKVLVIPRKRWFHPDMTEKLLPQQNQPTPNVRYLGLVGLRLYVPVNNFQSCRDGATASWVLPVLLGGKCILLKDTTVT